MKAWAIVTPRGRIKSVIIERRNLFLSMHDEATGCKIVRCTITVEKRT